MSQFVKSILNYYAAFTETRFSNKSTLNYKWLDDANLTLDLSFFTDFFRAWIAKLENNDLSPVDVCANQFKFEISSSRFCTKVSELLEGTFNREYVLKLLAEEKEGKELNTPEEIRDAYLEAARSYNLALRKAIEQVIHALQRDEITTIQNQFRATRLPSPTFNVPKFSQDIFDSLQQTAANSTDEEEFYQNVATSLKERDYCIILYDLLILLKQFAVVEAYGTSYLFLGSIQQEKAGSPNYPLCFIEVSFDASMTDCVRLTIPRDLVMLNTPAINSFEFQNVLTIPRAASFSGSIAHLRQMDSFLTGEYTLPPQAITTNDSCFIPAPKEGLPYLKYRFGLQVVKSEDKRILDYSELMTKIEKGEGSGIIDFVEDYIKEKVTNTYDETSARFREDYPKNSAKFFYSDNPLPLNPSQKKILTALGNKKNRIVVVDGPPGTGKSHTIGAITYWANQNNKSIIITSHKKEALDVVERMLTDKFKTLHPHTKPSVIRISKANDLNTLNTIENSLSLPVIDGAAKRADEFNLEAVERDQTKVRDNLVQAIDAAIGNAKLLPQTSQQLLRFIQLEEELAISSSDISGAVTTDIVEDLNRFEKISSNPVIPDFDNISLDSLTALYQRRHDIPRILDACNTINNQAIDQGAAANINTASLRNIGECKAMVTKLATVFADNIPLSGLVVTELLAQKNDLQGAVGLFKELDAAREQLRALVDSTPFIKFGNKKYAAAEEKFRQDYPGIFGYGQKAGLKHDKLLEQINDLVEKIHALKGATSYTIEFVYSLERLPADFADLTSILAELKSLKFDNVLSAIGVMQKKGKQELSISELIEGLSQLNSLNHYSHNLQAISDFQESVALSGISYRDLYLLLDRVRDPLDTLQPQDIDALSAVHDLYGSVLKQLGIDFANIASIAKGKTLTRDEQKYLEFIRLHAELSHTDSFLPEIKVKLDELYSYNQRLTENINDIRLKGFQNHPADMARISPWTVSGFL